MGLKFSFKENKGGDEPNFQICYEGENSGISVAEFNGNIIELTNEFAFNLMAILESDQIGVYLPWYNNRLIFRGKFDDCHSFAFIASTGSSFLLPGIPKKEDFKNFGLNYVGSCKQLIEENKFQQGDLIISGEFLGGYRHSFIYFGKSGTEDLFINCHGCGGYVDINGKWVENFNLEILEDFFVKKDFWFKPEERFSYVREGLRKGGILSIDNIDKILSSCPNTQTFDVYRKGFNTQSPS